MLMKKTSLGLAISLALIGLVPSVTARAEQPLIAHCLEGVCPVWSGDDAGDEIVLRQLFAAQIDSQSEAQLPRWVAYRVVGAGVGVASLLPREWNADELVSSPREIALAADAQSRILQLDLSDSQDRDYRLTEVTLLAAEQGRLAPITSFSATPFWDELNLLSNRARLPSELRLGPWSRLDQVFNEFVQGLPETESRGDIPHRLFVVSGPLPEEDGSAAGYFKVAVFDGRMAAFAFPQDTQIHEGFCDAQTPLSAIEQATGLDLFARDAELTAELAVEFGCSASQPLAPQQ
jgi:hypothetical protein